MIQVNKLSKTFRSGDGTPDRPVLSELCCDIPDGCVFGLVGVNGAGKSTLLRLLAGIYRPDSGTVCYDGRSVFEDPDVRAQICFIPDEPYFAPQATLRETAAVTGRLYPSFDRQLFTELCEQFGLDPRSRIRTLSKGMKRRAAAVLGLSVCPKYLLFDETFDGLDPSVRGVLKQSVYTAVVDRGMTVLIASHSLRELEDTADRLALLHRGGIVFESDVDGIKACTFKVQIAFACPFDRGMFDGLGMEILSYEQTGSVASFLLRGDRAEAEKRLRQLGPAVLDVLPLSLEEFFVYETGGSGAVPPSAE